MPNRINRDIPWWPLALVAALLSGCGSGEDVSAPAVESTAAPAIISGTATYRERMLLPPGAQLEVTLLDVSLADAPAITLAMQRTNDPGAPPYNFELEYDPATIVAGHTYVVRATIRQGEQLMFTTDTAYPVLTRDAGTTADVLLVRVASAPARTPLVGTRWNLSAIGGEPVTTESSSNDAYLQLLAVDNTASGNSGCNRFSGTFTRDGQALSFSQMVSTRMACAESAMALETQFLTALETVDGFEIDGRGLRLTAAGTVALTFVAGPDPAP